MATHDFSIEYLAMSLLARLDRKNIFPPKYDDVESFVPVPSNNSSSTRPKRPPNAFLICRKNVQLESKRKGSHNMRVISKVTSILWRNATDSEKSVYKNLFDRVYEIHSMRNSSSNRQLPMVSPTSDVICQPSPFYPHITTSNSPCFFELENNCHSNNQLTTYDLNYFNYFKYFMDSNNQIVIFYDDDEQNQLSLLSLNNFVTSQENYI
ncbi:hypothetical protein RhiirA1_470565 [Rhizophagus irregularis]|uniref:HMG box domain-containing protein n=3 Tax=Rhizophagus irregularis TaxID=588596 RepID=U9SH22_RHIID|nr:hypothetical protein GLOIN_2v1766541 [Rhizophagus irregularis DAOM 181602=DAOM 197198]ANQ32409.1 MATA-HMG [Rhizophagus irregularis]EXX52894.1 hypothetical protein RirG_249020 [Rhizophagus irregularis DAOM 197198w]PKC58715.1 hypothetical protein RhiirA1_470565 [Rhizophagus irregularis]POG78648.1 hypothetical protein GLOIN_2v1766541 [Rhizophagus irregularis DAOM 181602=DAOM 197198]UZO13080.1 hypothetical protein OCT59_004586 [Rhizophagus irregularis]|eukprot:XP_025185514.1 hypothetical protein GLOIN_2v1766541 [Rhizophagus irregularis DAOM 181602=DAOM 197198]